MEANIVFVFFVSRHFDIILEYKDMVTKCRNVVVLGIRHTCTVRQYKRLLQRRGRILACGTREQDSRPGPNIRVFNGSSFNESVQKHRYYTTNLLYCCRYREHDGMV